MILYVRANLVYKASDYLQDKSMFTVIIKNLFSRCLVRLYQNYEKPCHSQNSCPLVSVITSMVQTESIHKSSNYSSSNFFELKFFNVSLWLLVYL
jgi:hypothetical protein